MNDAEKKAEELLRCMGESMYRQRIEDFDRIDRNTKLENKAEKRKKLLRNLRTAAAVFCIMMLSMAALTVTSDAFRGKIFDFLCVEQDGHCDFIKKNSETADVLIVKYPEYLPEGYVKTDEEKNDGVNVQIYQGKKEDEYLFITQMVDEGVTLSVDNEYATREKCYVGICEAYYICDNESRMLVWDEDGILYEIASSLDKAEMIEVAENMK